MPKTKYEIHISDVQAFKQCRRAWNWSSNLRGNLTPIDKYMPFFCGTLVHHALEMWYRFNTLPGTSIDAFVADHCTPDELHDSKLQENITLAKGLVEHYLLWQAKDRSILGDSEFEFISPEHKFITKLWSNTRKEINYAGRFDGVVKHSSGKYFLWEIKTTRSIMERERQLDLDEQTTSYLNVASEVLGLEVSGIIYTLIRKKLPEMPKVLSNGDLSQSRSQDITPEYFINCIRANQPQLDNSAIKAIYGNYINWLASQPNKYFKRIRVSRNGSELVIAKGELINVAQEMINPKTPIYMSAGVHCKYCLFPDPCIAMNKGDNYKRILAENYTRNTRLDEE